MQHTEKYQLNLIDRNDAFSPDPLNENAQKLEAALEAARAEAAAGDAAQEQARAADFAALDARLRAIEAHKLVIGITPNDGSTTENLGFTPRVLYAIGYSGGQTAVIDKRSVYSGLRITEGGFYHDSAYSTCTYIAFA